MNSVLSRRSMLSPLLIVLFAQNAQAQATEPPPLPPTAPPPANPEPLPTLPPPPVEPIPAPPPLAGWHGGLFYLRDSNDNFRLYFQGRAQIDMYNYFGPGVPDTKLKSTLFLRRVRPELSGEFLQRWQWALAGDFVGATTPIDNPNGSAGADAQTVGIRAQATDVFVNYRAHKVFNLQVGQYDAPFTMENRTSDKYIPFMERSLAVRALGIPSNKEAGAMLWGETADRLIFYSVGVFDGEGQNRPNLDDQAEVMGRVFTHPIGEGALKDFQIGGSFRYTGKNSN
jgi:phosphate-selective porin